MARKEGTASSARNKSRSHSEDKKNRSSRARARRSIEISRITADISFILRGHPPPRSHRLDDCRKRLGRTDHSSGFPNPNRQASFKPKTLTL